MSQLQTDRPRPRVVLVSQDPVSDKVAGSALRYLEMARILSDELAVTLAVPAPTSLSMPNVRIEIYEEERPETLRSIVAANDIAVISGYLAQRFPFLRTTSTRLVVDLIAPFLLENLQYFFEAPLEVQVGHNQRSVEVTNELARLGDFFICGSERQRDFWLGVLAANSRLNPHTIHQDASARQLIDVVGFGVPARAPVRHKPVLRDARPAFGSETKIVWWGGGLWDWLDSITLVQAWPQVLRHHPEARLVFGTGHPNPAITRHSIAEKTRRLAVELGECDRTIFFVDWVAYDQREAVLCEANIGAVLHPPHLETRFATRTRTLDFIWAGLPILITEGDVMSEFVQQHHLGWVVPPQDPARVAEALSHLLNQSKADWAPAFEAVRDILQWANVVVPLKHYCLQGDYAPDRIQRRAITGAQANWRGRFALAHQVWRTEGARVFGKRLWQYLRSR